MVRYMLTDDDEDVVDDFANAQPILKSKSENPTSSNVREETPSVQDNAELAKMRLDRIRQTGNKMNTQEGLNDLEKEPAYMRRNIQLDNVKHSSESTVSRFTLGDVKDEEGNDKSGLSDNNSFLHDNVD